MSSDFLNFVVALPAAKARRTFAQLVARQRLPDLVGPDEEPLFHVTVDRDLDLSAVRRAYAGRAPAPGCHGQAFVAVDPAEILEELTGESFDFACTLSMGDATLAAIDRVLALPRGVPLLEGRAVARLRPKRRARVLRAWEHLLERMGGPLGAASRLQSHLADAGRHGAALEIIEALTRVLHKAEELECDALIFVTTT